MSLLQLICFILDHIPELVMSSEPVDTSSGYFFFDEDTGETHDL